MSDKRQIVAGAANHYVGIMRNLAPLIHRQRLVVEGIPAAMVAEDQIRTYLRELSAVVEMTALIEPMTHRSDKFGWAGWIHWEESGAHFYAWEQPSLFFSVDIYTCRWFDADTVIKYTDEYFGCTQIVHREF
ncbi:S-adenosylmethionine decarboxylase [Nocardia salmonicida]|uniref:S-adenosylmethionine decarboxylase n=1 Tax=Nocardia salmonicida TaxID=53431 RepID=UPI003CE6F78E